MKSKLLTIINHYGLDHQKRKLVEEIYELFDALAEINYSSVNFSNNMEKMINHITEEYADCLVVMEQIRAYWDLDLDEIEEKFKFKVDRTLERLEDEHNR